MTCEAPLAWPAGRLVRSKTLDFSASVAGNDIPLDFLDPVLSTMGERGYVDDLAIRLKVQVDTAAGEGAREQLFPQVLARINIRDRFGTRVDLAGSSLACINYVEWEQYSFSEERELGASQSNKSFVGYLRIPVRPRLALRPEDFRWSLAALRGGSIQIDWSAATLGGSGGNQMTIDTGTATQAEIYVLCIDEGRNPPEMKSRMVCRDWSITAAEQVFPVNGRLRSMLQYIGEVGASKATRDEWALQNISSQSLQLYSVRDDWFTGAYRATVAPRRTAPALAKDETDPVLTKAVVPIFVPRENQPTIELPPVTGVDWRTDLAFAAGTFVAANKPRMIATYIEERGDAEQPCRASVPEVVKAADGKQVPFHAVHPKLQRILPAKIDPSHVG